MSNGKKKGEGNTKNGNRYLAWAYVEAANFAIRYCEPARKFYQRAATVVEYEAHIAALERKVSQLTHGALANFDAIGVKKPLSR